MMNNATRWIISLAIGAAIEGALFGLYILTSRDFTHEGPDTSLSVFFGFASMWAGISSASCPYRRIQPSPTFSSLSPCSVCPHSSTVLLLMHSYAKRNQATPNHPLQRTAPRVL
jgi:hypothetical protein